MLRIITLIAIALMFAAAIGCNPSPNFRGKDLQMVQGAAVIKDAINNFRNDTMEFPAEIEQAKSYVAVGKAWPDNPYNGQPVTDTHSPDFDPATSVGNVYYQKFYRDEQLVGFQLHVYGDKDKLWIFGNTAVGIKE